MNKHVGLHQHYEDTNFRPQRLQWKWVLIHVLLHGAAFASLFLFSLKNFILFLFVHYFIMCFGITIGYHRLLSHRSFRTFSWIEYILAFIGVLSFQGGPRMWVAIHRAHHSFTDELGDAHSAKKGFLWSHQLWMWYQAPNGFSIAKYRSWIRDLNKDKFLIFLDKHFLFINLIVCILLFVLLPIDMFLWVVPFRIVFGWHTTWMVNSIAHGQLPFLKNRISKPVNSTFVSLFTCGEGLHKNHHDYPSSPSFEKNPEDFDLAYRVLVFFAKLKLISLDKVKS